MCADGDVLRTVVYTDRSEELILAVDQFVNSGDNNAGWIWKGNRLFKDIYN